MPSQVSLEEGDGEIRHTRARAHAREKMGPSAGGGRGVLRPPPREPGSHQERQGPSCPLEPPPEGAGFEPSEFVVRSDV